MAVLHDPNDKYDEYKVDFHGLVEHEENENKGDAGVNDWHARHADKKLERFCDDHPSAPQCKVFDDWRGVSLP